MHERVTYSSAYKRRPDRVCPPWSGRCGAGSCGRPFSRLIVDPSWEGSGSALVSFCCGAALLVSRLPAEGRPLSFLRQQQHGGECFLAVRSPCVHSSFLRPFGYLRCGRSVTPATTARLAVQSGGTRSFLRAGPPFARYKKENPGGAHVCLLQPCCGARARGADSIVVSDPAQWSTRQRPDDSKAVPERPV